MAEKKVIDVEVRETGLDELNEGLKQTETQTKKTGKSIEDVTGNGGAIAILDSMTGGLATRFRDMFEASKLFSGSLTSMRTAFIATGIGAFVVAAGLLVAYWDDIVDFIEGANKKLAEQNALIEKQIGYWTAEEGLVKAQIDLAEAQGKSTEHLKDQLKAIVAIQIKEQERYIEGLKRAADEEEKDALRLSTWEKISGLFSYVMYGAKIEGKISKEEEGGINEFLTKTTEAVAQLDILKLKKFELDNPTEDKDPKGKPTKGKDPVTGTDLSSLEGLGKSATDFLQTEAEKRNKITQDSERFQARTAKIHSDIRTKVYLTEQESKLAALMATGQGLIALADVLGQTTGAGKALASAGALINTFLGITEVWSTKSALLEPFATTARIASTIAVAASGFAAVKSINSVQVPNTSVSNGFFGGGGGGGSTPGQVAVPSFNIVGNSGVNQLADVISQREQKPLRAYVVSSDVRSGDELDRTIRSSATLG